MSARMQHGQLVHIELQVALGARKCDRVVVAKNLDCDHRERLALSRIDLPRHNRGAGFVFGKLEQRYIVFDRFYQTVHPAA